MTSQKHIAINASTVAAGGGLIVAIDIIKVLSINPEYNVTLICPNFTAYRELQIDTIKIYVPRFILKQYLRWWLDYIWLRKTIKKLKPDLIVNLGNLPVISKFPQIIFNDNAFASEDQLKGYNLTFKEYVAHSIRKFLFHRRLKFIKYIIVQSELEKKKFETNFKNLPAIVCLHPLLPTHLLEINKLHFKLPPKKLNQIRLGSLSSVHGHKNIKILIDVLEISERENFPLQIIFTLFPSNTCLSKKIAQRLRKHIISGNAINIDKIKPNQISDLMNKLDGLILPSLNESFSLNIIEAIYFKKVLLVSDRAFAKEICGNYAIYFNPLSPSSIFNTITKVFGNVNNEIINSTNNSFKLSLSTNEQIYSFINSILK